MGDAPAEPVGASKTRAIKDLTLALEQVYFVFY
jgi:hypothetical protein